MTAAHLHVKTTMHTLNGQAPFEHLTRNPTIWTRAAHRANRHTLTDVRCTTLEIGPLCLASTSRVHFRLRLCLPDNVAMLENHVVIVPTDGAGLSSKELSRYHFRHSVSSHDSRKIKEKRTKKDLDVYRASVEALAPLKHESAEPPPGRALRQTTTKKKYKPNHTTYKNVKMTRKDCGSCEW